MSIKKGQKSIIVNLIPETRAKYCARDATEHIRNCVNLFLYSIRDKRFIGFLFFFFIFNPLCNYP